MNIFMKIITRQENLIIVLKIVMQSLFLQINNSDIIVYSLESSANERAKEIRKRRYIIGK